MTTKQPKWTKVRAGHYSLRVGDRERIDVAEHYDGFLCRTRWEATRHVEGEKTWMRDVSTERIGAWSTLREAKAGVS